MSGSALAGDVPKSTPFGTHPNGSFDIHKPSYPEFVDSSSSSGCFSCCAQFMFCRVFLCPDFQFGSPCCSPPFQMLTIQNLRCLPALPFIFYLYVFISFFVFIFVYTISLSLLSVHKPIECRLIQLVLREQRSCTSRIASLANLFCLYFCTSRLGLSPCA